MKYLLAAILLSFALIPAIKSSTVPVSPQKATVVFVGDIMLGRYVETLSLRNGWNYPFVSTTEIFSRADAVIGNLEGPVPSVHEQTPNFYYGFNFDSRSIDAMKKAGIGIVTLANNHTSDAGKSGYEETVSALQKNDVASFGYDRTYLFESNGQKIRFAGLNDTFAPLNLKTVSNFIRGIKKDDEFLVVFTHWGKEYSTEPTPRQRELGHALIDFGADAVIGSHPHVVQESENYNGKTIYYSLGNFIFDQYFSDATQKGLAVKMELSGGNATFTEIPLDLSRSRPKLLQ